ncbi:MAG: hypothetical protein SH820_06830 [Xanthomonadales bacterium]|nr:hypothetical protein [Xanthomonadales bacterium]
MHAILKHFSRSSLFILMVIASPLQAQQDDITFFVIGKHASYSQDDSGEQTPVDFSFFAEIFLSQDGDASNGRMTLPGGEDIPFVDYRQVEGGERDNLLKITGKERYADFAALQADFPDGEYQISFNTPSGPVQEAKLLFRGDSLPQAPLIILSQGGSRTCSSIDPNQDLQVTWSRFDEGGADPNGLLDDLIFVILTNEDGIRIAHSGRPFENKPFLTYASDKFIIPADILAAGHIYALTVEHAILDDTRTYSGIIAMTTRAVTTKMSVSTLSGTADENRSCAGAEGENPG